jgi:hypothetical protein
VASEISRDVRVSTTPHYLSYHFDVSSHIWLLLFYAIGTISYAFSMSRAIILMHEMITHKFLFHVSLRCRTSSI